MASAYITGGEKLQAKLDEIAEALDGGGELRVGFLAGATYPDGTPVALIAAIQDGGAPSVGIPPRPFFRNMVAAKSPEWPEALGNLLKANNYDLAKTFAQAGLAIMGQLQQSIVDTNAPPLAESTIRKKGFDKPLIDSSHMINSIDFEVVDI